MLFRAGRRFLEERRWLRWAAEDSNVSSPPDILGNGFILTCNVMNQELSFR